MTKSINIQAHPSPIVFQANCTMEEMSGFLTDDPEGRPILNEDGIHIAPDLGDGN